MEYIASFRSFLRKKNRRCLCELAKQIGFIDHAREVFNLEGQIASYKHLVRFNRFMTIFNIFALDLIPIST